MTAAELKQKIKESMINHLKTKGYPDMTYDAIAAEIPRLWDKLSDEGLLKDLIARGFKFEHFRQIALQKKADCETMDAVNNFFKRGPQ